SFDRTVEALQEQFGSGVTLLQLPIGEEASFSGLVDLLVESAVTYTDGRPTQIPVPAELGEQVAETRAALVEGIVVSEDDLMERYLADEAISPTELAKALASGVAKGTVFPVLAGSASRLIGVDLLARFLVDVAPAPTLDGNADASAVVFKTIADPYVGKVSLFKALGTIKADAVLANVRSGADERLHQLLVIRGKDQEPTPELAAGDVGAVTKLADVITGDVLTMRGASVDAPSFETAMPVLPLVIRPRSKSDEDKLANALHRVCDEDPALRVERNPETRQTLLWGMGETHLAIVLERLARKFGVEVDQEEPKVPYRETITGTAEAEGRYKKQTGGHGQFGVAFLRLEPLERGSGFEFVDKIVGGAIPRQFIPAVEKGVIETMHQGGVLGFPVVDVRVTCFDGKYHTVDSSELSFKMAASMGFKEAEARAHPVLLEPVSELVITVPEAYQGDVMGDLNSKRARIQSSSSVGDGEREIIALAPTSEVQRYAIDLRSLTGGRGRFSMSHSHYDPTPSHLADKIRAANAKDA
ncbi:MAG: elongation factor G, partial [Acidimicrobiia bacterium]